MGYAQQKNRPRSSSATRWKIAACILGSICLVLGGLVIAQVTSSSDNASTNDTDSSLAPASQDSATADAAENATLTLELANYGFRISGYVADEQTRAELEQATATTYGALGQFDVAVDPQRADVTTIPGLVQLPQNLYRLVEGSFAISGSTVTISGRAPDVATQQVLTSLFRSLGFTTVNDQTTLANLEAPTIRFIRTGDQISLVGDIADRQIGEILTQVLGEQFGQRNVQTDGLSINPAVYSRFRLITIAGSLRFFAAFGDFELTIENNKLGGVLPQGVGFSTGSASISADQQAKLATFPPLLVNLPDTALTITGHTDAMGSDGENQLLSEQRAQAIAELFIANGIPAARLTAVGNGSNDPIASNTSAEGRAQNRRVTFQLT